MDILDEKKKEKIWQTIVNILSKGNDVLIQNRKNGFVIIEQKVKISYRAESK
ncbi:MAG: hypothetical protein K2K57_03045 [Oscillospiraceae bacterium]|nr:hypothetical protein [Oscillospiraceae bacterium]